jgi:hypothetical protein
VEKFKVGNVIYDNEGRELNKINYEANGKGGLDGLVELCLEVS